MERYFHPKIPASASGSFGQRYGSLPKCHGSGTLQKRKDIFEGLKSWMVFPEGGRFLLTIESPLQAQEVIVCFKNLIKIWVFSVEPRLPLARSPQFLRRGSCLPPLWPTWKEGFFPIAPVCITFSVAEPEIFAIAEPERTLVPEPDWKWIQISQKMRVQLSGKQGCF